MYMMSLLTGTLYSRNLKFMHMSDLRTLKLGSDKCPKLVLRKTNPSELSDSWCVPIDRLAFGKGRWDPFIEGMKDDANGRSRPIYLDRYLIQHPTQTSYERIKALPKEVEGNF